jgi:lysophospholipase L1-like esterase
MKKGSLLLCSAFLWCCGQNPTSADSGILEAVDSGIQQSDSGTFPDAGTLDASVVFSDSGMLDSGAADAGRVDSGIPDASIVDASIVDAGVFDSGTQIVIYPYGKTQSPLGETVAAHIKSIAALAPNHRPNYFSKIGDSITVGTGYFTCFAGNNVNFDGRTQFNSSLNYFKTGTVNGTNPFQRVSLSATVGWSAPSAIAGNPTPLQQEIDAALPRYATVMFGTNDVGFQNPYSFAKSIFTIVDTLSLQGVIPILSTVPPRNDSTVADTWVQRYNAVIRGVAQARQIPFVDLNRELMLVTNHGVLLSDGVHLNSSTQGTCIFTPMGLDYGNNVRNFVTFESLTRALNAVNGTPNPDLNIPLRNGSGILGDEIVIDSLPFVDVRDTRIHGASRIPNYPGCSSVANEAGNEVLYKLVLPTAQNLMMFVAAIGTADIDIHVLSGTNGSSCLSRNDKVVTMQLAAGTHYLSLDTFVNSSGTALAGEYVLVVIPQ